MTNFKQQREWWENRRNSKLRRTSASKWSAFWKNDTGKRERAKDNDIEGQMRIEWKTGREESYKRQISERTNERTNDRVRRMRTQLKNFFNNLRVYIYVCVYVYVYTYVCMYVSIRMRAHHAHKIDIRKTSESLFILFFFPSFRTRSTHRPNERRKQQR